MNTSEFRVDRPGRYRTREGKIAVVTNIYNGQGGTYIAFTGNGENFWTEKGEWAPGIQYKCDLVAYLGPLEEEKRDTLYWNCSKPYQMHDPWCPFCRATNANVNPEAAQAEMTAKTQPEGFITRLERELAEALSEVGKLKLEIASLERSRNHCEFCDREIAKPVPRVSIPLTTPQIERYTTPMLGTQR